MATVTANDSVFCEISNTQFQTFQRQSLVSKVTQVFDRLRYYVVFINDNDILTTIYQLTKSLVEHAIVNEYDSCNQLHKYLDIIYAYFVKYDDYLMKLQIQFDFIDV